MTVGEFIIELERYPKEWNLQITDLDMQLVGDVLSVYPSSSGTDSILPANFKDADTLTILMDETFKSLAV